MHFPRASMNFAAFEEQLARSANRSARIDSNGLYCSSDERSPGVLQRTLEPHHRWDVDLMSTPSGSQPAARPRDKLSLLRSHPLFRDLPSAVIEHLGSYMKTRRVARGTAIFAKGDPGAGLMGVLAGSVKVSVASADGKDIVLNVFREGDVFGEIALLDGRPRTADATAMSDCELIVIERRDFVPFLSSNPDVMLKFIEILCSRLRHTSEQVQDITFLNLPTRLAKTLIQLTGGEEGAAARRKAAITQREISQMIGMSRESTNKQLRAWEKRGWIKLERGGVAVLAPDKLAVIAAEGLDAS
jgi:CRP/FNR family cyclic AMP-dependent transcriptional regulator